MRFNSVRRNTDFHLSVLRRAAAVMCGVESQAAPMCDVSHKRPLEHPSDGPSVQCCGDDDGENLAKRLVMDIDKVGPPPPPPDGFVSKKCRRLFEQLKDIKTQLKTHSSVKPHECPTCGKVFQRVGDLNVHLRMHTGVKPHSCSICGKAFVTSSKLNEHLRTHSGAKPYSCETCGKAFSQSSTLAMHARTHSLVKAFGCHLCEKSFLRKDQLRVHLRRHPGALPHSCASCGEGFSEICDLKAHLNACRVRGKLRALMEVAASNFDSLQAYVAKI